MPDFVRPLEEADLELVLQWRNHPDVRAWMYTTHEISWDEHCKWYAACNEDPGRHLLVVELDGRPTGFANLIQLRGSDVAEWGFYLAPDAPRGSGLPFGVAVLDHCFGALDLHKVSGHALAGNERSVRFHARLGFQDEGVRREQHLASDGTRHSVACFGLLADEWPDHRLRVQGEIDARSSA
jgi:UDP-4-amino-4,6-dideoxy-N-acetyl-beta-L-altrosamine N-acetyltransferase